MKTATQHPPFRFPSLFLCWIGVDSHQRSSAEGIGPVSSVLMLGEIAFAIYYPLSRASHTETRAQLAARREASAD